jgi:hypothetical protein
VNCPELRSVVVILLLALQGCGVKVGNDTLPSNLTERQYYLSLKRMDYNTCYKYLSQSIKSAVSMEQFSSFMEETWHDSWSINDSMRVVEYAGPKLQGGADTSFAIWTVSLDDSGHQARAQSADIWVSCGTNCCVAPAYFLDINLKMLPTGDIAGLVTNRLHIRDLKSAGN